jgi:tetratricopeptide (TPR) repeat protein
MLSERHFATKNYDKALNAFESLRAAGAATPEIIISIARCQEALNNADKSLAELVEGAKQFPQSPELQSAIGDSEMRRRRFPEARAAYDKALAIDPKFETAYLRIADLLVGQAKVGEAAEFLGKALETRPSSAMLHYGVGDLKQRLAGSNRDEAMLAAAEREFREAIRLDPTMLAARHQLAKTLLDKGDAAAAMKELAGLPGAPRLPRGHVVRHRPRAAGARQDRGRHQELRGLPHAPQDGRARAAGRRHRVLRQAGLRHGHGAPHDGAQLANKLTAAHYYLGRVALDQKNTSLAVQKFQLASDEEAANNEYRYWLGRALLDAGQAKQGFQEFSAVAENIKNDVKQARKLCDAHYQRGLLRFNGVADGTNDWRGAQGDFKAALDCDDKRAEVWTAYADTFEVNNQANVAVQHYSKAIAVNRDFALAYYKRGLLVQRTSENPERSKGDFEAAVRLDPKMAEPNYQLCVIYISQGARALAKNHCKKYLELAPNGDNAADAREQLKDLDRGK